MAAYGNRRNLRWSYWNTLRKLENSTTRQLSPPKNEKEGSFVNLIRPRWFSIVIVGEFTSWVRCWRIVHVGWTGCGYEEVFRFESIQSFVYSFWVNSVLRVSTVTRLRVEVCKDDGIIWLACRILRILWLFLYIQSYSSDWIEFAFESIRIVNYI